MKNLLTKFTASAALSVAIAQQAQAISFNIHKFLVREDIGVLVNKGQPKLEIGNH